MSTNRDTQPLEGGCDCKKVRYRLLQKPMYVHCCHCRWCQRESGSAFALNAILESKNVQHTTSTAPEMVTLPSESEMPQIVARCPSCKIAVWSNYGGEADNFRFVKVGSLDDAGSCPPDIQIYTASKQPWVQLNDNIPTVEEYYDRTKYWPKESLERRERAVAEAKKKQIEHELASKTEGAKP